MELIAVIQRLDNIEQLAKGNIMSLLRTAIVIALAATLAFAFGLRRVGRIRRLLR